MSAPLTSVVSHLWMASTSCGVKGLRKGLRRQADLYLPRRLSTRAGGVGRLR